MNSQGKQIDIYLYGMTVYSSLYLLDAYPQPDTYGEIIDNHQVVGGEAGNAAIILSSLGCRVKLDGPFLGSKTRDGILDFLGRFGVDCSGAVYDPSYEGVMDMVLIDKHSRTVFGRFGHYFSGKKRWGVPDRAAIAASKIVAVDPFFQDESVEISRICLELGKPYVTIDSPPESEIHRHSAAIVVSNEFIRDNYKDIATAELFSRYIRETEGLVVFTFGGREIIYGRKGQEMKRMIPYKVDVKSTLGAGDIFRAGIVYGLLNKFDDEKTAKFAAAVAALVCTRFPYALNPPCMEEILALAGS